MRGASNNWVVHGDRTASGMPLLCNDPHLDLTAPSTWLLTDVQVPGVFGAIGASFVGLPGVVLGRNMHNISWGVTNTGADVQGQRSSSSSSPSPVVMLTCQHVFLLFVLLPPAYCYTLSI